MKAGTQIETYGRLNVAPERGVIVKPRKINLPLPGAGWHIVRFDSDGGRLCMHENAFRVIDNRGR